MSDIGGNSCPSLISGAVTGLKWRVLIKSESDYKKNWGQGGGHLFFANKKGFRDESPNP